MVQALDRLTLFLALVSYVDTGGELPNVGPARAGLSRLGPPFSHLHLHQLVALTGRFFQFWPVNNLDVAATVGDETGPLEHSRRYADAGTDRKERRVGKEGRSR